LELQVFPCTTLAKQLPRRWRAIPLLPV